jgi:hypothetical protein
LQCVTHLDNFAYIQATPFFLTVLVCAAGVAVFDFDKTLTTKHVGMFDLNDAQKRAFGGAARLSM